MIQGSYNPKLYGRYRGDPASDWYRSFAGLSTVPCSCSQLQLQVGEVSRGVSTGHSQNALSAVVYTPSTLILVGNSNTGILVQLYLQIWYTLYRYWIPVHRCSHPAGAPTCTAHPIFVLTLHNHTSIESARSQHYNGVWYAFSRAHSAPICQLHCSQSIECDRRGTNYRGVQTTGIHLY